VTKHGFFVQQAVSRQVQRVRSLSLSLLLQRAQAKAQMMQTKVLADGTKRRLRRPEGRRSKVELITAQQVPDGEAVVCRAEIGGQF